MLVQIYGGVDIPTRIEVIAPEGAPEPPVHDIWFVGLRVAFDWRYYLGSGQGGHR